MVIEGEVVVKVEGRADQLLQAGQKLCRAPRRPAFGRAASRQERPRRGGVDHRQGPAPGDSGVDGVLLPQGEKDD